MGRPINWLGLNADIDAAAAVGLVAVGDADVVVVVAVAEEFGDCSRAKCRSLRFVFVCGGGGEDADDVEDDGESAVGDLFCSSSCC